MSLTGQERITRILKRQSVDRIGLYEHFWSDTQKAWKIASDIEEKMGFDIIEYWPFSMTADLDFVKVTVAEDEEQ